MSVERIKEKAAEADRMIAELAGGEQPVVEATGENTEATLQGGDEQVSTDQGVGVAVPAATEDASPSELAELRQLAAKWEQRYRSLDGMIQARDRQIEQLHQLLAGMQQAAKAPEPEAPAQAQRKYITEKDEDQYGADLVDMARRAALEVNDPVVAELKAQVQQLQDQLRGVSQVTAVSAQDRFESRLTQLAPNWRSLDSDEAYIGWLQKSPARLRVFQEAVKTHDAEAVAEFFNDYAEKHQPPAQPRVDARLEKQLAPGKSKSVPTPAQAPSDKKMWTRSEIAQVYSNRKKYTADEFSRLDREIAAAQREGRVDYPR